MFSSRKGEGKKMEQAKKLKPVRKKKRTKAQEEKRMKLLHRILDKWVYVKYNDGVIDTYAFLKHRIQNENSTSKVEQVLLSGEEIQDGVYLITDYDIDLVYDKKLKRELVELKMKKFDKKTGFDAEEELVQSFDELKNKLVGAKYLNEEEFLMYCQSKEKPPGIEEMLLAFSSFDGGKE
jgi:hypothetical protein